MVHDDFSTLKNAYFRSKTIPHIICLGNLNHPSNQYNSSWIWNSKDWNFCLETLTNSDRLWSGIHGSALSIKKTSNSRLCTILSQNRSSCESVVLDWALKLPRENLNFDELREALVLLPELKDLEVTFTYTKCVMGVSWPNPFKVSCIFLHVFDWRFKFQRLSIAKPNFCLLDGATLIEIVRKVERVILPTVNCSAEAIFDAFEVIFLSAAALNFFI